MTRISLRLPTVAPLAASAAETGVSLSRAELRGTEPRVEGTPAPSARIRVDGVSLGMSVADGSLEILPADYTTTRRQRIARWGRRAAKAV